MTCRQILQHLFCIILPVGCHMQKTARPNFCARTSTKAGWIIRRLWWRFYAMDPESRVALDAKHYPQLDFLSNSTASVQATRTLVKLFSSIAFSSCPTPGRCTSTPMKSFSSWCMAISISDAPFPNPISNTTGALRPNSVCISIGWLSASMPNFGHKTSSAFCWPGLSDPHVSQSFLPDGGVYLRSFNSPLQLSGNSSICRWKTAWHHTEALLENPYGDIFNCRSL